MIREKSFFGKLFFITISAISLFDSFMKGFSPCTEKCPFCHSVGNCHIHAYYTRNLIDYFHGAVDYGEVKILRVKCSICKRTHAILPDMIIPYTTYALPFIFHVLEEYLGKVQTVGSLCAKYNITPAMLYRWLKLYGSHKRLWLGAVRSRETSLPAFLNDLLTIEPFSRFTLDFFALTTFSFLQKHANPANSHRVT